MSLVDRLQRRGLAVYTLIRAAFEQWRTDNASFLAAGLSYFAVFSLIPLLLATVAILSMFLEEAATAGEVAARLTIVVGARMAEAIQAMLVAASDSKPEAATLISVLLLLYMASRIFGNLQVALNMIWSVPPRPAASFRGRVWRVLEKRLVTFGMVVLSGVLLISFFFVEAALGVTRNLLGGLFPILDHLYLWKLANLVLSLVLLTLGLGAIYKFLPDTRIAWRDVWIGAVVTAALLGAGRFLIGLYFAYAAPGSVFGIAGSVAVVLVGIHLSAQIFLFGAEFTWIYAYRRGSRAGKPVPRRKAAAPVPPTPVEQH